MLQEGAQTSRQHATPRVHGLYDSADSLCTDPASFTARTTDDTSRTSSIEPGGLEGMRVGVVHSMHAASASTAAREALHSACEFLVQSGACMEDVHVPEDLENFFEVAEVCMRFFTNVECSCGTTCSTSLGMNGISTECRGSAHPRKFTEEKSGTRVQWIASIVCLLIGSLSIQSLCAISYKAES